MVKNHKYAMAAAGSARKKAESVYQFKGKVHQEAYRHFKK